MFEAAPAPEKPNSDEELANIPSLEAVPASEDVFGAMEGENLEQKAVSSLADDIAAPRVDYESVLERAKLSPQELELLRRGANGIEYLKIKKEEPDNFIRLEEVQEKVRNIIREMLEEYQGEEIS